MSSSSSAESDICAQSSPPTVATLHRVRLPPSGKKTHFQEALKRGVKSAAHTHSLASTAEIQTSFTNNVSDQVTVTAPSLAGFLYTWFISVPTVNRNNVTTDVLNIESGQRVISLSL